MFFCLFFPAAASASWVRGFSITFAFQGLRVVVVMAAVKHNLKI